MALEYCCVCGNPTGKAGKGDDSLYIDDDGPYCEECWDEMIDYYFDGELPEATQKEIEDAT